MIKNYNEYLNDNFKKWFGNSKVVDASGNPLVVYHGTSKDFDSFDTKHMGKNFSASILGIYFTNGATPDMKKGIPYGSTASEYAFNSQEGGYASYGGANVLPVYLSIKNPLYIEADGWYSPVTAIDKQKNPILREIENGKYDGIITYYTDKEEGTNEVAYVVFKPEQIKSAIGNNGQFNPNNKNINENND